MFNNNDSRVLLIKLFETVTGEVEMPVENAANAHSVVFEIMATA